MNLQAELERAEKQYNEALQRGDVKKDTKQPIFAPAYVSFAENSLATASIIYDVSKNPEKRALMNIDNSYSGFMWVVVSSYFSMFYMASALLAKKCLKVGTDGTHKHTKNAFLHVYVANHFLDRVLGMDYAESKELAEDLLGEREKRSKYQYNVGIKALETDAELSLKRARNFFQKTREIVNK
jgi:uncharacterized protein (UPF0332 family)